MAVSAVVGENGALYFHYDHAAHTMRRRYVDEPAVRATYRERLREIAKDILAAVPGAAIAADQHYRETDLAIDYCEDVPRLPPAAAERVAVMMRERGLTAKVSSIHVNGWFGRYDKLAMTRTLMRELPSIWTPRAVTTYSSATRPTMRPCSGISVTPSAWLTCAPS